MALARLLGVVVVVSCVVALGTTAATLESTLTTGPLDGLEPNWSSLPISEEEAADLKDALDIRDDLGLDEDVQVNQTPEPEPREATPPPADVDVQGGGSGPGRGQGESGPEVAVGEAGPANEDPLAQLLAWLKPLALVTAAVGITYRYRRQLGTGLMALLGMASGWRPITWTATKPPARWPGYEPEHEVDRAWLRIVRELNLERVRYRTPGECARAAEAVGMPPEPVETLRQTFEEVRYGGKPVTDERRRRVRDGLRALQLDTRSR